MALSHKILEPEFHALVELVARMKSNLGSSQEWAKDLEKILEIEEMKIYESKM
jgi:hypothetical protein